MTNDREPKELQQNWVDLSVASGKGVANLIPFVGPFLAEIIGYTIPNQRMDRVAKFATELQARLDSFQENLLQSLLSNEEFTILLEEGIRQAASAVSDERRDYIASLLINGLNSEQLEFAESKHVLRMLGEINDVEVVWLKYHEVALTDEREAFLEKHKETLMEVYAHLQSTPEELDKEALQKSYKEHLTQLGLLTPWFRMDMETRTPKFDGITGSMEIQSYLITGLGRLLLKEIGLREDETALQSNEDQAGVQTQ